MKRAKKVIPIKKIKISSDFKYEVSVYLLDKNRAECVDSKFYSSPVALKTQSSYKKINDTITIIRFIDLLSAPEDYLLTNNYIPNYDI